MIEINRTISHRAILTPMMFVSLLLLTTLVFGQKRELDIKATKNWMRVSDQPLVTRSSRYVVYGISGDGIQRMTIQDSNGVKIREETNVSRFFLSNNHQYLIYLRGADSLEIFEFATQKNILSQRIKRLVADSARNANWVAWFDKDLPSKLTVWSTSTGIRVAYENVADIVFNKQVLLLKTKVGDDGFGLTWIKLLTSEQYNIWQGKNDPQFLTFDKSNNKIAFLLDSTSSTSRESKIVISGLNTNTFIIDNSYFNPKDAVKIAKGRLAFNLSGERLFFNVQKAKGDITRVADLHGVSVDVWCYKDSILQSQQLSEVNAVNQNAIAVYNLNDSKALLLAPMGVTTFPNIINVSNSNCDNLVWIQEHTKPDSKQFGSGMGMLSIHVTSTRTGESKSVVGPKLLTNISISPLGKYIAYYNSYYHRYFLFDFEKWQIREIGTSIVKPLYNSALKRENSREYPFGVAGWLPGDSAILIYDQFDIWKIPLAQDQSPTNMTGEYGRKHKIVFRFDQNLIGNQGLVHREGDFVFLRGIFMSNNSQFIYRECFGLDKYPTVLMGGKFYCRISDKIETTYLIEKHSSSMASNWYLTSDFRRFRQITDINPQANYKWYSSQLIKWKAKNGQSIKGILYTPDDFDFKKKYPLIVNIYEKKSGELFDFIPPTFSSGEINVPWFVSRGYIVFQPDIHYEPANPGKSALVTVLSGLKYLASRKWFDKNRIGLSGSSFGGYEVNYIIAHTKLFAAAEAGYAVVDLISDYNSLGGWPAGKLGNLQYKFETSQYRMHGTPWDLMDKYLANSPILNVKAVSTPLLILHNKEDPAVPWAQGIEWFNALRRNGKRVWLLQYDSEGHGLENENAKQDYTIREQQFFDHYLKGAEPPKWMTQGIPARLKSIDTGLEIDFKGQCGMQCVVCKKTLETKIN